MAADEIKGGMINAILAYCYPPKDAKHYRTDCVLLENGKLIATDGSALCVVDKNWMWIKDDAKGLYCLQKDRFYKNTTYLLKWQDTHITISGEPYRDVWQDDARFPDWENAIKSRKTNAQTASFPPGELKRLYDLADACGAKSVKLTPKGDDPMKVEIDGWTADATVYICPLDI